MNTSRQVFTLAALLAAPACRGVPARPPETEPPVLSRTEFTDRIESFLEYQPLAAGRMSRFSIHLTDLAEGSPVAEAQVELAAESASGREVARARARPGRTTGVYVAELAIPEPGEYRLDCHVQAGGLDERMRLDGFRVQ